MGIVKWTQFLPSGSSQTFRYLKKVPTTIVLQWIVEDHVGRRWEEMLPLFWGDVGRWTTCHSRPRKQQWNIIPRVKKAGLCCFFSPRFWTPERILSEAFYLSESPQSSLCKMGTMTRDTVSKWNGFFPLVNLNIKSQNERQQSFFGIKRNCSSGSTDSDRHPNSVPITG